MAIVNANYRPHPLAPAYAERKYKEYVVLRVFLYFTVRSCAYKYYNKYDGDHKGFDHATLSYAYIKFTKRRLFTFLLTEINTVFVFQLCFMG
jgi:hypothetical protein